MQFSLKKLLSETVAPLKKDKSGMKDWNQDKMVANINKERLRPVKGLVLGLSLSVVVWPVIIYVIYLLFIK